MFLNFIFLWLSVFNNHSSGNLSIELDHALNQGKLLVYVYNNAAGFPTKPELAYETLIIECHHTKQVKIDKLPFDAYAIILIHDKNGNEKLDRNWLGLPAEPYALSGHPKFRFGPPLFEDVKFEFNRDEQVLHLDFG